MKIWLDDIRDAPDDSWTVVRTVQSLEIVLLAHCGEVEEVSLDHDLGYEDEYGTGYDAVKQMELDAAEGDWDLVPKRITIHSANPVGRNNMQAAIDSIERMRNA